MSDKTYKTGHIYPEADDNSIMSFGKHRGKPLMDVPDNYIIWLHENGDFIKENIKEDSEKGSIARYMKSAYDSITRNK